MEATKQVVLVPLFYFVLAIAAMAAINAWTFWPEPYKFVLPLAFAIVAIIDFVVRLNKQERTAKPIAPLKPAPPKATPAPATVVPKPEAKKDTTQSDKSLEGLKIFVLYTGLIILGFMGVVKLFQILNASNQAFIASARGTTVVHAFPIDHTYNQKVERDFLVCLDPGKVYEICELNDGQHWQWYFDRDIEYRIKVTGHEPFISLPRNPNSGIELTADKQGVLQVRTNHRNNFLHVYRLQAYHID